MTSFAVDLNCDLGEGVGDEPAILPFISSASVACGQHAGDPSMMRETVEAARAAGVAVGAHPGFADRENFGRRVLPLGARAIRDLVTAQVGALEALARAAGVRLQHVKAHGALYHVTSDDEAAADALCAAVAGVRRDLILVGFPGTRLERVARARGLRFAAEGFVDRGYGDDGRLLPRGAPGALLSGDDAAIGARAVAMVRAQAVQTASGRSLPLPVHTLCLHGDTPGAAARARAVRAALDAAGVAVRPLASLL
jgi:UPF0271 protein